MKELKHLLLITVLALLVSAARTQAGVKGIVSSSSSSAGKCSTLNYYLSSFPSSVLLSNPTNLSSTELANSKCKSTWTSGTCCNETRLISYGKYKNSIIDASLATLKYYLFETERKVDKYKKKNDSNRYIIENELGFLAQLSLSGYQNSFEQDSLTCWNYMKQVRGASLCNACSAKSASFFSGNKVTIDDPSCTAMMTKCWPFFDKILAIAVPIGVMNAKLEEWKIGDNNRKIRSLISSLDLISKEIGKNPSIDDMKTYRSRSVTDRASAKLKLCNALYVLNGKTFLEKILPVFDLIERKADEIIEGYRTYLFQRAIMGFNGRRVLQDDSFSTQFSADWPGNYDGILTGDITSSLACGIVMNLTLAFP